MILDALKNCGLDEDDIEEIKTTADVTVATLVYTLEKFYEMLDKTNLPKEIKSELMLAFMRKGDK